MVAQKDCPLTPVWNRRSLFQDIDDWKSIFHLQRHEHAWHEREVKIHVRFVAIAKVSGCVLRPLICLGKQHSAWKFGINVCAQFAEVLMGFREILAACVLSLVKIRDSVQTKS